MKVLLVFSLFLVSVGGGESRTVRGYPGGGVLIRCRYEKRYTSNPKYLCKGSRPNCADQIKTEVKNEWSNTGRFSLLDNTSSAEFWVMIRDLTVQDSGLYQCAVDIESAFDVYTPVELTVEKGAGPEEICLDGEKGAALRHSAPAPLGGACGPRILQAAWWHMWLGACVCGVCSHLLLAEAVSAVVALDSQAKQTFSVSINSLTEGDSGEYWCGAESDWTSDNGYKVYITQIYLRVTGSSGPPPPSPSSSTARPTLQSTSTPISSTSKPTETSTPQTKASEGSTVIVVVSVILAVLLIGLLLLIVTLQKKRKTQGSHTTTYDYDKIKAAPGRWRFHSVHNCRPPTYRPLRAFSESLYGNVQLPLRSNVSAQILFKLFIGGEETKTVTGYPGGDVLIECEYKTNYTSNPKYLCKGPWSNCTDRIRTGTKNEWSTRGRFMLYDDTRAVEFRVKIRDLTVEDSGLYHCGVDVFWLYDVYTPVELTVKHDFHGVTQNGSGSSSVTSPALVLVETPNESVCGGTVVSTKMTVCCHTSRRPGVPPPPPLPHHLQELCEDVQAAWDGLSQDTIRNLYSSIPRRLACWKPKLGYHPQGQLSWSHHHHFLIFTDPIVYCSIGAGVVLLTAGLITVICFRRKTPRTKPVWTGAKNEWRSTGRFSLLDNTSSAEFWVMIRDLTVQDSGLYQCAVDKILNFDVYTPVELTVEEDLSYKKIISVSGHVGGGVAFSCKYPQSHRRDPKFFCRRVGTADCIDSRRWRNDGRLHDDGKQAFTVSINNLTVGDSGEYWCGAESDWTSDDGYKVYITQVHLRVTVGGGESRTVRGYPGGGVLIRCRYDRGYTSNPKYLCTGAWPCMTKPVWTDAKNEWASTGRFSLLDNTSSAEFWVMIRDLTVEDSGTYKCAVDIYLAIDVYTPVELTVEEDDLTQSENPVKDYPLEK
ncbi:hypothetical protein NFI96_004824 [Prochilodus magdalenae]|nr:hypothetical protein NFI96_004824 [Prochilodus magdalenae]